MLFRNYVAFDGQFGLEEGESDASDVLTGGRRLPGAA
jgi:hypothetical protein